MDKAIEVNTASRYFRIKGGNTVLEFNGSKWIRWDNWDGPIETSIWKIENPALSEIKEPEAKLLIQAIR